MERAIAEARDHGTDLVVLNASRGEALTESRRLYDDEAAELTQRLESSGVSFALRRVVQPGQPADQILDVAEKIDGQMIVIGLRRRSATGKLLFGSNAQQILLRADCPVLAVKAPVAAAD